MMNRNLNILLWCAALLPFCGCGNVSADSRGAAFEYREIYLPEAHSPDARELGLNSLNTDWGLWGHNLGSVLPSRPSQSVYAKVGGTTRHEQFCFMSNHLYEYIEEYISDNYGSGEHAPHRFAILPNDNGLVCLCAKCTAEGNTRGNASPAVFRLIRRLAERFPGHTFFASWYQTTRALPAEPLPANAGVLVSAMDYPLATVSTAEERSFEELLRSWSGLTERIYIWDYVNNFDDYFTPFPVFEVMQRRLQLYARNGVKGVFFNGSGTDYSTMGRLKVHVLTALLDNPDTDWRTLVWDLCRNFYPLAGDAVAQFVLSQENFVLRQGRPLPLYDGVANAVDTYLPEVDFRVFFETLQDLRPRLSGSERTEIGILCDALALTRLELMRLHGETAGCQPLLDRLAELSRSVEVYSESCWTIEDYVRDYRFMQEHAERVDGLNLLKGVRLAALTPLDPDYSDISVLTDGLVGLPSNYHCGNLLSSADPSLQIAVPKVAGMRQLRVCMTRNPAYRIAWPRRVMLSTAAGTRIGDLEPRKSERHPAHAAVVFDLPASAVGESLVLTLVRDLEVHTMGIDEIEGF